MNPDTKTCAHCGCSYSRKPSIHSAKWAKSRYCSNACRRAHHYAETPGVCTCGNPATARVHFENITAEGWLVPGHLDVCADCYDFMMETDPGCSATPRRPRTGVRVWTERPQRGPAAPTAHVVLPYRR